MGMDGVVDADAGGDGGGDGDDGVGEIREETHAEGHFDTATEVESTQVKAPWVETQVESLALLKGQKRRTPPLADDDEAPEGKQRRMGEKLQEGEDELQDRHAHAIDKGKGRASSGSKFMDQDDIHDKTAKDDYDYQDHATSFDYANNCILQDSIMALGEGDEVLDFARQNKKTQKIMLRPAGVLIPPALINADCSSPTGYDLELVSAEESPPWSHLLTLTQPFHRLYPIPQNTGTAELPQVRAMRRDDWPSLLCAALWRRGITRGVVECLPGFILTVPFYLSKRAKSYFIRVHIDYGISCYLYCIHDQPELGKPLQHETMLMIQCSSQTPTSNHAVPGRCLNAGFFPPVRGRVILDEDQRNSSSSCRSTAHCRLLWSIQTQAVSLLPGSGSKG